MSGHALRVFSGKQISTNSALFNDAPTQFESILLVQIVGKTLYHIAKSSELILRGFAYVKGIMGGRRQYFPAAYLVFTGSRHQFVYRCVAYSTCRIIDNAAYGLFIVSVGNQSEVGDDVFNFLALVKAQTAIDAVRNTLPTHFLFKRPTLRVGAV